MKRQSLIVCLIASTLVISPLASAPAQGKGHGSGKQGKESHGAVKQEKHDKSDKAVRANQHKPDKANKEIKAERSDKIEKLGKPKGNAFGVRSNARRVDEFGGEVESRGFRVFTVSPKRGEKLAGFTIATATKRGAPEDAFVISPVGNRLYILNRTGVLLADFDSDRDIGVWKAVTLRDTDKKGAPSFCRSGAGHPVWGRQWCIDKGFGLGSEGDWRWSRVVDYNNVIFRNPPTAIVGTVDVPRASLVDLLGDVVVNRLAAQAITLGLVDPLIGRWLGEPSGPRVLLLSSADRPVAEVVDLNRDDKVDLMLVTVRP